MIRLFFTNLITMILLTNRNLTKVKQEFNNSLTKIKLLFNNSWVYGRHKASTCKIILS